MRRSTGGRQALSPRFRDYELGLRTYTLISQPLIDAPHDVGWGDPWSIQIVFAHSDVTFQQNQEPAFAGRNAPNSRLTSGITSGASLAERCPFGPVPLPHTGSNGARLRPQRVNKSTFMAERAATLRASWFYRVGDVSRRLRHDFRYWVVCFYVSTRIFLFAIVTDNSLLTAKAIAGMHLPAYVPLFWNMVWEFPKDASFVCRANLVGRPFHLSKREGRPFSLTPKHRL